jgi:hypothetical protein
MNVEMSWLGAPPEQVVPLGNFVLVDSSRRKGCLEGNKDGVKEDGCV